MHAVYEDIIYLTNQLLVENIYFDIIYVNNLRFPAEDKNHHKYNKDEEEAAPNTDQHNLPRLQQWGSHMTWPLGVTEALVASDVVGTRVVGWTGR